MKTETKTITQAERLQLIGLTVLAGRLNRQQDEVVRAMADITGETGDHGYFGLTSDLAMEANQRDPAVQVDTTLRNLGINVEGSE